MKLKLALTTAVCVGLVLFAADALVEHQEIEASQAMAAGDTPGAAQATQRQLAQAARDPLAGEADAPEKMWLFDPRPEAHTSNVGVVNRYRGPVPFNHKGHVVDHRIRCNSCHHDHRAHRMEKIPRCEICHRKDAGEWTEPRLRCVACHQNPGFFDHKGTKGITHWDGGIKNVELLMLGDAFHQNCDSCHHQANTNRGLVLAPVSCRSCHTDAKPEFRFVDEGN